MIAIGLLFIRMLCDCFKSRQQLEAEIMVLRHQFSVLHQRAPRKVLDLIRRMRTPFWGATKIHGELVCSENSDTNILMMQPADQSMRHDATVPLSRTREWRVLVQRAMRSRGVVIARIGLQHPTQLPARA